ncbi:unnamed protein product [Rhizophagus irregularis]|uniref:Uncharacterized protein n=1 Tax=Rhizophagus irregularis TaxID=588596 RepID=A0A2I1G6E2_9GLOM|nr:hypothetical protein RhiirA4_455981 [Rhizophagus irregularis]CAB4418572.1 unnamed protein product [Rhizophagus irregularis]
MITPMLKTYISSRARYLSPADYKDIMQYRDMKSKPLAQLSKKYNISNSRLYQIWRGQEFNRIQWNDLAVAPTLENKIRVAEISESTDPVSKESAGSKAKKTGGKKRSQGDQATPGTKKEIILPTEFSGDVLDLYKETGPGIEKLN